MARAKLTEEQRAELKRERRVQLLAEIRDRAIQQAAASRVAQGLPPTTDLHLD